MKKISAFILTILLLFSVTSCSASSAETFSSAGTAVSTDEINPVETEFINYIKENFTKYSIDSVVFENAFNVVITVNQSLDDKDLILIEQHLSFGGKMYFPDNALNILLKYSNGSKTFNIQSGSDDKSAIFTVQSVV